MLKSRRYSVSIFSQSLRDKLTGKGGDDMRILLAEDEKRMAAALVALLKQEKYDIDHIVPPVYIGWGYLWKNPTLKKNAEEIFNAAKKNNSNLFDDIQNNKFYHPQYLMVYGKNRERCKEEMKRFKNI